MPDTRDEVQPARAYEGLAGMPVRVFAQVRKLAPGEAFRTAAARVVLGLSPKTFLYWTSPAALVTASESDSGRERGRGQLDGLAKWNLSCAELIAPYREQEDSPHIAGPALQPASRTYRGNKKFFTASCAAVVSHRDSCRLLLGTTNHEASAAFGIG